MEADIKSVDTKIYETVYYENNGYKLKAYLSRPAGRGPFPLFFWIHGSEKKVVYHHTFAQFWVDHGFIFFKPMRSGHDVNPGKYILDDTKEIIKKGLSGKEKDREMVKLHERANNDVIAALKFAKKLACADLNRIVVAGGSLGGIQTLFTAEKDVLNGLGIKCFIAMAPGFYTFQKWLAERLPQAVKKTKKPIFILQAENDYTLFAKEALFPVIDAKGFPNRSKLFPVHIKPGEDINDHSFGHQKFYLDPSAWQDEVIDFLKDCGILN